MKNEQAPESRMYRVIMQRRKKNIRKEWVKVKKGSQRKDEWQLRIWLKNRVQWEGENTEKD